MPPDTRHVVRVEYEPDPEHPERGVRWKRPEKGQERGRLRVEGGEPESETPDPLTAVIDAFLAEREALGLPRPSRQQIEDRVAYVLGNVEGRKKGGINSPKANAKIVLVHKDLPPYFSVTTASD